MKKLVIFGAGGFGREVKWIIERINSYEINASGQSKWDLLGFIDDGLANTTIISGLPVLGGIEWLQTCSEIVYVACAIGSAMTRKSLMKRISSNKNIQFPNLIDPSAVYSESVKMGCGNIICAGTIMTVDILIGNFCIFNLDCTIGHDSIIDSFVTMYPSVNVSGCVSIGQETEIGTGCHIIQGIEVGQGVILGAGAVLIKNLENKCTAVGNPAQIIKYRE